jgi:hypothetical protein
MRGSARPNCHTLAQSHLEPGRAPTASMPAAARPHCMLGARDWGMLAIVPIILKRITEDKENIILLPVDSGLS